MTGSPEQERGNTSRSTPLVGKPSLAVSLLAHMSFFPTSLKRSLCSFKPIEDQPVLIAAGLPFYELHRTVPGILLFLAPFPGIVPVSYTHLRAHEPDSYLVCRLLLE